MNALQTAEAEVSAPPMKMQVEVFTHELFQEIGPLAQKAWDECSEIKKDTCAFHGQRGFMIEPDDEQYLKLQSSQSLLAFTLRDDEGQLQGYAMGIIYRSLHHRHVKCGNVDTFYIEPQYRAYIRGFIACIEEMFNKQEVVVIGWPVTASGNLRKVLDHLGYIADDVVMEKQLCALSPQ